MFNKIINKIKIKGSIEYYLLKKINGGMKSFMIIYESKTHNKDNYITVYTHKKLTKKCPKIGMTVSVIGSLNQNEEGDQEIIAKKIKIIKNV